MAKRASARDQLRIARSLDWELIRNLKSERYDPDAFPRFLEELLKETDDHWYRLQLRRSCAARQFCLAEHHSRGIRELTRLFKASKLLGHSDLIGEYLHVASFAKALADRGQPSRGRDMLTEFAKRAKSAFLEAEAVERYIAEDLARIKQQMRGRQAAKGRGGKRTRK